MMLHIKDSFIYGLLNDRDKQRIQSLINSCQQPISRGIEAVRE